MVVRKKVLRRQKFCEMVQERQLVPFSDILMANFVQKFQKVHDFDSRNWEVYFLFGFANFSEESWECCLYLVSFLEFQN